MPVGRINNLSEPSSSCTHMLKIITSLFLWLDYTMTLIFMNYFTSLCYPLLYNSYRSWYRVWTLWMMLCNMTAGHFTWVLENNVPEPNPSWWSSICPSTIQIDTEICLLIQTKKVDWLIQERLDTRDPMKRENFFVEYGKCVLCEEGTDETMM